MHARDTGGSSIGLGADALYGPLGCTGTASSDASRWNLSRWSIMAYWTATRLRVGFFEGGCAWVLLLKDLMYRNDNVYTTSTGQSRCLNDYLNSDQVLVGVEGNEWILPYVIKQCGAEGIRLCFRLSP